MGKEKTDLFVSHGTSSHYLGSELQSFHLGIQERGDTESSENLIILYKSKEEEEREKRKEGEQEEEKILDLGTVFYADLFPQVSSDTHIPSLGSKIQMQLGWV